MALITTFATTPLTAALYPPWYQKKLEAWKRGEIDWDDRPHGEDDNGVEKDAMATEKLQSTQIRRLLVYLRLDSLSGVFTFISLLGGHDAGNTVHKVHPLKKGNASTATGSKDSSTDRGSGSLATGKRPLEVHGLRMIELTERTSSVMKVAEMYDVRDPIVNVFHTFGLLNHVAVSSGVAVAPEDSYAETLVGQAADMSSDLLLVPWSESGTISEGSDPLIPDSLETRFANGQYNRFVMDTLSRSTCSMAILVNKGFGGGAREEARGGLMRTVSALSLRSTREVPIAPITDRSHHVFLPYFGGPDDRVALRFVLQLAQNTNVTATILYVETLSSEFSTEGSPASEPRERTFFSSIGDSLPRALEPRVVFDTLFTSRPLNDVFERAKSEVGQSPKNAGDLVVVGRGMAGQRRITPEELMGMLPSLGRPTGMGTETRQALGGVAEVMICGNLKASVVVIQAGKGVET